jgi:hypothetical protein
MPARKQLAEEIKNLIRGSKDLVPRRAVEFLKKSLAELKRPVAKNKTLKP